MATVLLDTSVVSLFHPRRYADPLRERYIAYMDDYTCVISFQTYAELWKWAEKHHWGSKSRDGLVRFINEFVVVPFDFDLGMEWARISVLCEEAGRPMSSSDLWIAATAVLYQCPLITHDSDFVGRDIDGLQVISHLDKS